MSSSLFYFSSRNSQKLIKIKKKKYKRNIDINSENNVQKRHFYNHKERLINEPSSIESSNNFRLTSTIRLRLGRFSHTTAFNQPLKNP